MTRTPFGIVLTVGLFAFTGCATAPGDAGFGDVSRDVARRTGLRVQAAEVARGTDQDLRELVRCR